MHPDSPVAPGEILRVWRDYIGLTGQELADKLKRLDPAVSPEDATKQGSKGAVANWESGRSSPSPEKVRQIAVALGLNPDEQDAMIGMWRAAGSASALPPRVKWEHNYHPEADRIRDKSAESGPAWVWFRCMPGEGTVSVSVGWAPWGEDFTVPATRAGILVSAPVSLPNPPLQVTFDTPGWADFGNGIVPPGVAEALQIKAVDGLTLTRGRFADPPELNEHEEKLVKADLRTMERVSGNFKVMWRQLRPRMGAMRPNERVQPLEGAPILEVNWAGSLLTDDRGELIDQLLLTPEQIKRIRKIGRDLSVEAAADAANAENLAEADDYITGNQIENLERRSTVPDRLRIIARLDHVYQLDGYLGIERTLNSITAKTKIGPEGLCAIRFPDFWIGPVWLQLRAPDGPGQADAEGKLVLRWGFWRRLQQVRHGTIVTTRKATADDEKLMAYLPPGWSLAAGTGVVPGAVDINHDWYPATWEAARKLVLQGARALWGSGRLKNLSLTERVAMHYYIRSRSRPSLNV